MLEGTADLLLMYANTNTFISLEPFCQFNWTPIEACAQDIVNEEPCHFALNCQKSDESPTPNVVDSDGNVLLESSSYDGVTDGKT